MCVKPIMRNTICQTSEIPLDTAIAQIHIGTIKSQFFQDTFLTPKSPATAFALSPLLCADKKYPDTLTKPNIAICTIHVKSASASSTPSADYISSADATLKRSVNNTTIK